MKDETTYQNIDETIRRQFESGWAAGKPESIEAVVGEPTAAHYLATLEELVHIELEFRWKNRDPLKRPQLEDYLKRFEPLADPEVLSRLVNQEVKLRIALGETPTSAEYQQRFPEATLDIPAVDQADQDTGVKSEDDVDTQREMPTLLPGNQGAASDKLDSATMMGNAKAKQKVILEGDFVPGYDLLGELGRGGMGVVYQARDQKLKRIVALKMILSGVHASEEDMQRFQTEAEAVAKLQHPNIVQIFEVGEHKGNPYISLEYQEGGGLDKKIASTPQNIEESAQLIETLARAIAVAHEEEVIHRDLKPANILLSAEGEPKITDFGLAKRMDEDSNQTKSGAVMGTPSYMAPEQAASSNETIGPAADTYALGAILYHMLTGRPPFQAETQLDTLMQVISDEPVPPRRLNSKIPADLETICLKCLQKDIRRRYASAEGLAEDLRRFQAGEPIAARPVSSLERGWKWARRRPAMAGMLGVSVVALIALVAGGLWYNGQLRQQRNIAQEKTVEALRQKTLAEEQTELAKKREAQAKRARAEAALQKTKAEKTSQMAWEAVSQYSALLRGADVDESLKTEGIGLQRQFLQEFANVDPSSQAERAADLIKAVGSSPAFELSKTSLKSLEESTEIFESLHKEHPENDAYLDSLAENYFRLTLLNITPNEKKISETHGQAIKAYQTLVDRQPKNTYYQFRLCLTRQNLAASYRLAGQYDDALKVYQETRPFADTMLSRDPTSVKGRTALAQNYSGLGLVYLSQEKNEQALVALGKGIELWKQLSAQNPQGTESAAAHAQMLAQVGELQQSEGNLGETIQCYSTAAEIYQRLAKAHPENPAFKRYLAGTYALLSDKQWRFKERDESLITLRSSVKLFLDIAEESPDEPSYQTAAANLLDVISGREHLIKRPKESFLSLRQAFEIRHRLAQRFPDKPEFFDQAGKTLLVLVEHRAPREEQARDALMQETLTFYRQQVREHPDRASHQLGYMKALLLLAKRQVADENFAESRTTAQTALRIIAALKPADRDQVKRLLFLLHDQCYTSSNALGHYFEALFHTCQLAEYNTSPTIPPTSVLLQKLRIKAKQTGLLESIASDSSDYSTSLKIVEDLARPEHSSAQCCFDAARIFAIAIPAATSDASLNEAQQKATAAELTTKTMYFLNAAHKRGFFAKKTNIKMLGNDKYFASLRERDDFQQFVTEVEAAPEK